MLEYFPMIKTEREIKTEKLSQPEPGKRSYQVISDLSTSLIHTPEFNLALGTSFFGRMPENDTNNPDRIHFRIGDSIYHVHYRANQHLTGRGIGVTAVLVIAKYKHIVNYYASIGRLEAMTSFTEINKRPMQFYFGKVKVTDESKIYQDTDETFDQIPQMFSDFHKPIKL